MLVWLSFLLAFNPILTAGIVITTASLLLYALTFNLRDRVARSFAALLALVTVVYFCDALASTPGAAATLWLRVQWIGIAFIPAAYLHFSDALLATTGQPSRGRRRLSIRILYGMGGLFLIAATLTDVLVYPTPHTPPTTMQYLSAGPFFSVYVAYFIGNLSWAGWNFVRAYQRTQTPTTRRRLLYLMASAAAPAIGAFPFLLLVGNTAALHPLIFWNIAVLTNIAVTILLVVMAYSVAYFGVSAPDRIIKGRLLQWLLRGPVVASTVLAVYVVLLRYGPTNWEGYPTRIVPTIVIGTLLLMQFAINVGRLPLERRLFYGQDRADLRRLQILSERLLTSGDLRQFLETVLAGLCDALRVSSAFVVAFGPDGQFDEAVSVGPATPPYTDPDLSAQAAERLPTVPDEAELELFAWGDYWLLRLQQRGTGATLGLLGLWVAGRPATPLEPEDRATLHALAERAALALEDRLLQREVFQALDRLLPQIEAVQRLRATTGYASGPTLTAALTQPAPTTSPEPARLIDDPDLAQLVKQALSHYWGGPKLADSPLMQLRVVEQALQAHQNNPVNALRAVLAEAIERTRPEGQRKFTAEWVLYNILEMKFLQNRRVREVALRLAVSEADLYRKQRLAMEHVARALVSMEKEMVAQQPTEQPTAAQVTETAVPDVR